MAIPSTEVNKEKEQIRNMFDEISETYDRLNHFLSFSIDKYWRKRTIREVSKNSAKWLDVSTGTADLAILAAKKKNAIVTGVDISENMLSIGKEKVKTLQLENRIELKKGDAEQLPFNENLFDVCSVAFGVRNFENLDKGL
ncbi:class I SAM-dependent methyltransferase, partial [Bacteroidales bacterium OttesenSCG-928-C19]|nr:class I SAM-dependent methyltransferase [Bacteroidales bacterium OttesenSCG-928-C19]